MVGWMGRKDRQMDGLETTNENQWLLPCPRGGRAQNIEKPKVFETFLQKSNENQWFLPPARGAPAFWLRGVLLFGFDVQKINENQWFLINF